MKKNIIFGISLSIMILMISLPVSYALFSSSASNLNNSFVASSSFPTEIISITPSPTPSNTPTATPTPTLTPQIIINEVSTDGNNKVEWAELYNPSATTIDISGWLIGDGALNDPLPSGSTIGPNGYAVIIPDKSNVSGIPGTATTIELVQDQIGNGFTDAGDRIVLLNSSSTIIDQLSYGTDTTVFASPPLAPTSGQSLARIPNGIDTDSATDWVIDSSPTIGQTNL